MSISEKPEVKVWEDGSKTWEISFDDYQVKGYVPANELNGIINNYSFMAPTLIVLEENSQTIEEAKDFADSTGLSEIASNYDAGVIFVYPKCSDWDKADEKIYISLMSEIKMAPDYEDGIIRDTDFFTHELKGYYIRGTKFHNYIYSYGKSADYAARCLLKTIKGEFL